MNIVFGYKDYGYFADLHASHTGVGLKVMVQERLPRGTHSQACRGRDKIKGNANSAGLQMQKGIK
jgi:hypothetical protein